MKVNQEQPYYDPDWDISTLSDDPLPGQDGKSKPIKHIVPKEEPWMAGIIGVEVEPEDGDDEFEDDGDEAEDEAELEGVDEPGEMDVEPDVLKPKLAPAKKKPMPSAVRKRTASKSTEPSEEYAYIRDFPKQLLIAIRSLFPDLNNQPDMLAAFILYHMGLDIGAPSYQPPDHIVAAVRRLKDAMEGTDMQALSATMGGLQSKLNKMSDQMLQQQMLISYLVTIATGMHPSGKVGSGYDLKLLHEGVFSTTYAAADEFHQYKQVVMDYKSRRIRDAKNRKQDLESKS